MVLRVSGLIPMRFDFKGVSAMERLEDVKRVRIWRGSR